MKKQLVSKCTACQYRGRHIYVVGSSRFARELIVNFIANHTVSKSHHVERLGDVPVSNKNIPLGQKMILLDVHALSREGLNGLFQAQEWKAQAHNLIAFFNVLHEDEFEKEALKQGVLGFLYHDDSVEDLINGICAMNSGELWISRGLLSECIRDSYVGKKEQRAASHALSAREVEILHFLTTGGSNKVIADQLCISPHTVKTHLQNIFHKIAVTNRLQAVLWARKNL